MKFYEIMNNTYAIIAAHSEMEAAMVYLTQIDSSAKLEDSDVVEILIDDLYDVMTSMVVLHPLTGTAGLISFKDAMTQINKVIYSDKPTVLLMDKD